MTLNRDQRGPEHNKDRRRFTCGGQALPPDIYPTSISGAKNQDIQIKTFEATRHLALSRRQREGLVASYGWNMIPPFTVRIVRE